MVVTEAKSRRNGSWPQTTELDAERAVLGGLQRAIAEEISAVKSIVHPEDFSRQAYVVACAQAFELHAQGKPVDNLTLAHALEQIPAHAGEGTALDLMGGRSGLNQLMAECPTVVNLPAHAEIVARAAAARRNGQQPNTGVEVRWATSIRSKPIDWLWRGFIARGKITVFGGDPGQGKGMVSADVVARHSRGGRWPDGSLCPQGRSLILTGEDDPEDTVNPRLEAAGADRDHIGLLGYVTTPTGRQRLNLAEHAELIVKQAVNDKADLLIIDPLSSYIGNPQSINAWRDQDVRSVLDPLAERIREAGLAVVLVVHLNKSNGGKAMYRFQSSIATIAAARFGYLLATHPEDATRRVLAHVKSNLSKPPPSLSFRITETFLDSIHDDQGRVEWLGSVAYSCDDLLGSPKESSAGMRAEEFLLQLLAAGPAPSDEVKAAAARQGIGKNVLWEAKDAIGVKARKVGLDRWDWELPAPGRFKTAVEPSRAAGTLRDASVQNELLPLTYVADSDSSIRNGSGESRTIPNHPEASYARAREDNYPLDETMGALIDAEAAGFDEEVLA